VHQNSENGIVIKRYIIEKPKMIQETKKVDSKKVKEKLEKI